MVETETRMVKFVKRPGRGTKGKPITILANAFQIKEFPTKNVIQYDVTILIRGGETGRRTLNEKVWRHDNFKQHIGDDWPTVIYDSNKLAWSYKPLPFGNELNVEVDIGNRRPDIVRVVIKKSAMVALAPVEAWINGRQEADENVLTGMTFLNHLVSQQLRLDPQNICFRRTFFPAGGETHRIQGGVDVKKGLFLSVRAGANKLFLNVDVATTAFWPADNLLQVMKDMMPPRISEGSMDAFAANLASQWGSPQARAYLGNLRGIKFYTQHTTNRARHSLSSFTSTNATQTTFPLRRHAEDGSVSETTVTVAAYYLNTYNIRLRYPNLRLVRVSQRNAGYFPIELCWVDNGSRYGPKLNDRQTADMIRFTATRPGDRQRFIGNLFRQTGLTAPNSVAQRYGMKFNDRMSQINARILPAPNIEYSGRLTISNPSGQWDLKNKKFYKTGQMKTFGLLIFDRENNLPRPEAQAFLHALCNAYIGHGGRVENTGQAPVAHARYGTSPRDEVVKFYKLIMNTLKTPPDMIFCVFAQKSALPYYNEIKNVCDIDLGCVSQCLLTAHVKKKNPQYLSNVCMKVNAKLGGTTCTLDRAHHPLADKGATLVIGADVSHPAPNSHRPSFASMVGSLDLQATRFGAVCNVNGEREEMLRSENMDMFLKTMLRNFRGGTGMIPDRILYFRDGVSEQEYSQVVLNEVAEIKKICRTMPVPAQQGPYNPKLTVTICSKRHHYRFFPSKPQEGDRNGNVMPGTLIENDICDPSEYDFYLNSHKAIQGTARATHYYVIYDENRFSVDEFQGLCYNMCFTYIRSTTAVSLIPAAYYAHVAAKRATIHQVEGATPTPTEGTSEAGVAGREQAPPQGMRRLHHRLVATMWYI